MSSNPPFTIADLFNAQAQLARLQIKAYKSSQKHWLQRLPSLLYMACRFHAEITEFAQETTEIKLPVHTIATYAQYRNSPEFALLDQHLRSFVHTFCTHTCNSLEDLVSDKTRSEYQTLHNTLKTARALMGLQHPAADYSPSTSNYRYLQAFCATAPLRAPTPSRTAGTTTVDQLLQRAEQMETQLGACQQELSAIRELLASLPH